MLFERIISPGLAHYSYLIGDEGRALVIDPRRDGRIYVDRAMAEGARIDYILETHRHEDYLTGSPDLADLTGAEIWHADSQWAYAWGKPVADGQEWRLGRLRLKAILSPGHTPGMMSYLLYDHDGNPWVLFSGDALFAGEVGRVDLMGQENMRSMAADLYDTIFSRLLPLGDGIILCPAHGAGSACGADISERPWTTLGMERSANPRLQSGNREAFIEAAAVSGEMPPYFRQMERLNLEGVPLPGALSTPLPLDPEAFAALLPVAQVLDIRTELGYGSAHIPGSLSIWMEGVSSFAGWFLHYDRPLLLVGEGEDIMKAAEELIRMGYDRFAGYLAGGMHAWHLSGRDSQSVDLVLPAEAGRRLDSGERLWILDVRREEELQKTGTIPGAHHIHLTRLPERLEDVPRERRVYILCESGHRSMTAASLLSQAGWRDLAVIPGGFAGWNAAGCPIAR